MYKHELTVAGQHLAEEQTLPQNASADGNGGAFDFAGTNGAIEIVVKVGATAIGLADTKVLIVKLQHADGDDAMADLATIYSKTASGATTLAAGTELARYVLPSTVKDRVKAVLTTTDAAATGKITVSPVYLAR